MIDLVPTCESCGSPTVCVKCGGTPEPEPWIVIELDYIRNYDCEPSCLAMPKSWAADDWYPDIGMSDEMPEGEARACADIVLALGEFGVKDIETLHHDVNLVFTLVDNGYISHEHAIQCFQSGSGQGGPYASKPTLPS